MIRLCDRIKTLREQNNISQNELSKRLDTTRATISSWEMGINSPNAHFLIELSKFFKVSVDYLLGLDDTESVNISDLNQEEKNIVINLVKYLSELKNVN